MSYLLSPEAEAELAEAVGFYAEHVSANVARNFLALFDEKARLLSEFPSLGTPTSKGRLSSRSADTHTPFCTARNPE